jgi:hypothetical protein
LLFEGQGVGGVGTDKNCSGEADTQKRNKERLVRGLAERWILVAK